MKNLDWNDIVGMLLYLENKLGHEIHYQTIEPFPVDPNDIVDLQRAAARIGRFVGLDKTTFVISARDVGPHIAGQIELDGNPREAFIDLSSSSSHSTESALATLSHEIAHEYAQQKGVYLPSSAQLDQADEILTDILTVYLGLGPLVLNGCKTERVDVEHQYDRTITHRETKEIGYITRQSFADAYVLVCAMRSISESARDRHLNPDALHCCLLSLKRLQGISTQDSMSRRFTEEQRLLRSELRETQVALATTEKLTLALRRTLLDAAVKDTGGLHHELMSHVIPVSQTEYDGEHNRSKRYLMELQGLALIDECQTRAASVRHRTGAQARNLIEVLRSAKFPPMRMRDSVLRLRTEEVTVRKCWSDGTTLRVPAGKSHLSVRCPRCGYVMIVDTTLEVPLLSVRRAKVRTTDARRGWLSRWFGSRD